MLNTPVATVYPANHYKLVGAQQVAAWAGAVLESGGGTAGCTVIPGQL